MENWCCSVEKTVLWVAQFIGDPDGIACATLGDQLLRWCGLCPLVLSVNVVVEILWGVGS